MIMGGVTETDKNGPEEPEHAAQPEQGHHRDSDAGQQKEEGER